MFNLFKTLRIRRFRKLREQYKNWHFYEIYPSLVMFGSPYSYSPERIVKARDAVHAVERFIHKNKMCVVKDYYETTSHWGKFQVIDTSNKFIHFVK